MSWVKRFGRAGFGAHENAGEGMDADEVMAKNLARMCTQTPFGGVGVNRFY